MMKTECTLRLDQGSGIRPFTVAGAAQVKSRGASGQGYLGPDGRDFLLLPVELRRVNHTASTNRQDSTRQNRANPTIDAAMANQTHIDQIAERVERLLLRYEELQRTNALLSEQVHELTQERDSLRSRLSAARARVDALLDRLPDVSAPATSHANGRTPVGSNR
jgi:cell division protein ZapB